MQTSRLAQAEALYKAGKYEEAVDLLEEIMNEDTAYRDMFFLNGNLLNEQSLDALYLKGEIFCKYGDENEGKECLSAIPATHSRYYDAQFLLGMIAHKMDGDYDEALEYYQSIPKDNKNYFAAIQEIALLYGDQEEYQKALELLNSIDDNNLFGDVQHSIAHIYGKIGNREQQMTHFDKVPSTDKAYGKVQISKSVQLEKDGDIEAALSCLANIPTEDDFYYKGLKNRSDLLMENNRMQKALDIWQQVALLSPYYNQACIHRASIYAESKSYEAALAELDKVPALADEYLDVLDMKANIYRQGLKNDNMAQRYKSWHTMLEMRWCFDGLIGNCMIGKFTAEQELEFWNSISESSPEYYYAMVQKVVLYKKMEDFNMAQKLLDSIPQEEKKRIEDKYHYDFERIGLFEE